MPTRHEVIDKMKHQLDGINAQLDDLEAKAKSGQERLGKKYDEQVAQLRSSAAAMRVKISEIQAAGDERWEALVAEGEKVQKALVRSFNYFKSQLK